MPPKEFQETQTITVDNVEINQSVNIFGCKGTTIIINGKVNAINLSMFSSSRYYIRSNWHFVINVVNSSKTSILVQSVVSAVAVTASPSFQIQVTGSAPMIQLDSTDSGQIYLSKDSLNTEITTAKCSAININLPVADGEFNEQPVPEMFKTVVQDGKLVTTIVEHTG
jgi:adenylyl cyclase-associated protein